MVFCFFNLQFGACNSGFIFRKPYNKNIVSSTFYMSWTLRIMNCKYCWLNNYIVHSLCELCNVNLGQFWNSKNQGFGKAKASSLKSNFFTNLLNFHLSNLHNNKLVSQLALFDSFCQELVQRREIHKTIIRFMERCWGSMLLHSYNFWCKMWLTIHGWKHGKDTKSRCIHFYLVSCT